MLNISTNEVAGLFGKLLEAIKRFFAWLGILILPTDEELDNYPSEDIKESVLDDILAGA